MFGCDALYLHGRLQIVLPPGEQGDWQGVLVCCDKEAHSSLRQEFPALSPHPVLPKWLYVEEARDDFEDTVMRIVGRIWENDPRIGVLPKEKVAKKSKRGAKRHK